MSNFEVPTGGIITICGSMKFQERMTEVAAELTFLGYLVLRPEVTAIDAQATNRKLKARLDVLHFAKIEISESIYVVDGPGAGRDIPEGLAVPYIGESTEREIEYAKRLKADVFFDAEPLSIILLARNALARQYISNDVLEPYESRARVLMAEEAQRQAALR